MTQLARSRPIVVVALAALLATLTLSLARSPIDAASECDPFIFKNPGEFPGDPPTGTTWLLLQSCTTSQTIFIPDGVTFDGNGHTIIARDPAGGAFTGAVVRNEPGAGSMHVTNLWIRGELLAVQCSAGDDRLRGILLDRVSGTVVNTFVVDIRQGPASGCQLGNAIEARNLDADGEPLEDLPVAVTISNNLVSGYQKTGILVSGNVDALITRNIVEGDGPVDFIAQNGIQVGFGATGLISANTISGNDYTPNTFYACGVLIVEADGVEARPQDNSFPGRNDVAPGGWQLNEKDLCNFHRGGNYEPLGT